MESGGIQFGLGDIAGQRREHLLPGPACRPSYGKDTDQVQDFRAELRGAFTETSTGSFHGTPVITKHADPPRDGIRDRQQRLATTLMP